MERLEIPSTPKSKKRQSVSLLTTFSSPSNGSDSEHKDEVEKRDSVMSVTIQSDNRFTLSITGMNYRMMSHISQMVCVMNRRHFYNLMIDNKEILPLDIIQESDAMVLYR